MEPDDELCLCFHVTRRKVEQFLRSDRPRVASRLSECYGAGTGCGWCRPFLQRLHQQIVGSGGEPSGAGGESTRREAVAGRHADSIVDPIDTDTLGLPDAAEYAASRATYRSERGSRPDREPDDR
jgi:bacterioferritin-associated ferredoxin